MKTAEIIDHTALEPDTTIDDIENLCNEAVAHGFTTICVPPLFVKKAKALTTGSKIKVSTVIGFPFGYNAIEAKAAEIVLAIIDGADELEIVINISAVKNNDWRFLANELNTVMPIIRAKGREICIIIETGLLTNEEIIICCDIYGAAGVDFIKAGTGYGKIDITPEIIQLMRKHLANLVQIKVYSGIKNYSFVNQLTEAGACRVCSKNSIELVQAALQQN